MRFGHLPRKNRRLKLPQYGGAQRGAQRGLADDRLLHSAAARFGQLSWLVRPLLTGVLCRVTLSHQIEVQRKWSSLPSVCHYDGEGNGRMEKMATRLAWFLCCQPLNDARVGDRAPAG